MTRIYSSPTNHLNLKKLRQLFISRSVLAWLCLAVFLIPHVSFSSDTDDDLLLMVPPMIAALPTDKINVINGWIVNDNEDVIWGYAGHNSWWHPLPVRPNITRITSITGPLHQVEFSPFVDSMITSGFPAFEHNYGLWFDRRRDAHDVVCRNDSNVVGPLLIQPWARSGEGQACDGLSRYDLSQFNQTYFDRLGGFASQANENGAILINNYYMQHILLELNAHYADFAWRPSNNIQNVAMPNNVPAASSFYDVSDPQKRELHRAYIFRTLDTLGQYPNVIHQVSQEFTGDSEFVRFWISTISEWEKRNRTNIHISLAATKDVQDTIMNEKEFADEVASLNLQYWWYQSNGSLFAPAGGRNVPGRYALGFESANSSPTQIYRQVREYRDRFPNKAILHQIDASRQQTWAFLMGGGSLLLRYMNYASNQERNYVRPVASSIIQNTYNFINQNLASELTSMLPVDLTSATNRETWGLANGKNSYLFYQTIGGSFTVDLRSADPGLSGTWFSPRDNLKIDAGIIFEGGFQRFQAPSSSDWALLISRP